LWRRILGKNKAESSAKELVFAGVENEFSPLPVVAIVVLVQIAGAAMVINTLSRNFTFLKYLINTMM
jgi:hypothetical protein